jgi:hypothetical protein
VSLFVRMLRQHFLFQQAKDLSNAPIPTADLPTPIPSPMASAHTHVYCVSCSA